MITRWYSSFSCCIIRCNRKRHHPSHHLQATESICCRQFIVRSSQEEHKTTTIPGTGVRSGPIVDYGSSFCPVPEEESTLLVSTVVSFYRTRTCPCQLFHRSRSIHSMSSSSLYNVIWSPKSCSRGIPEIARREETRGDER
jgi:hypothetical protein